MIKAVLLDLDNTLLRNDDARFVSAYIERIDTFFETYYQQPVSHAIRSVPRQVYTPSELEHTFYERTLTAVAEATGHSTAQTAAAFSTFYHDVYPGLQDCTEPVSLAPELVQFLHATDYAVVIATNPLYPDEAIRQRLRWAGLPGQLDAYALVTTAENMHFTKAQPAYYAEIVARVGVEPDEALMVGDRYDSDIANAHAVGLNTYHINETVQQNSGYQGGTLAQFYEHIQDAAWLDTHPPRPLTPEMIEPELFGNVAAMFGMLKDIPTHYWEQHPIPDEWSVLEIVCHLLESEQVVQLPRLQRILSEENPFLSSPKPPPAPREAHACDPSGLNAARKWAAQRHETITWLRRLSVDDWRRPARHSIFGLTTLLEMAHFTAQHDRLHLNQLCQTLGRCE